MSTICSRSRVRIWVSCMLVGQLVSQSSAAPLSGGAHALQRRAAGNPGRSSTAGMTPVVPTAGDLPLAFEINEGQAAADVLYAARAGRYAIDLTRDTLRVGPLHREPGAAPMRMRLVGADTSPLVRGVDELPGRMHYMRGSDQARWHSGIRTYRRVQYAQVYPGIDLLYYGNRQQLEYDFHIAPGADPGRIALRFEEADQVTVDQAGTLVVRTAGGEWRQPKAMTYQVIDGARREIDTRYRVNADGEVGFVLGDYDHGQPLVIDPVLVAAFTTGLQVPDAVRGVAVDAAGNVYAVGDLTIRPPSISDFGDQDIVVLKFDPSGTTMLYGAVIGGDGSESGNAIAVDGAGYAYITGRVASGEGFPITADAFSASRDLPGPADAFLMKLDTGAAIDNSLVYSTFFNVTEATGIALDPAGMVYLTGTTTWGMPTTAGVLQERAPGSQYDEDAFVAKFDLSRAGDAGLVYATYLGGGQYAIPFSAWDRGRGIAVDAHGSAIVVGETNSADFPVVAAYQPAHGGFSGEGFVARLNASGSELIYSTYIGGERWDVASGVALDPSGYAYVTGSTTSLQLPVTAASYQPEWAPGDCGGSGFLPCADAFVAKFDPAGGAVYVTYLGGYSHDYGYAIDADNHGNAHVTGYALSPNYPVTELLYEGTGGGDAFITTLNPEGTALVFSTRLGGAGGNDEGRGIAVDTAGHLSVVGWTEAGDFPGRASRGDKDGFVVIVRLGAPVDPTDAADSSDPTDPIDPPQSSDPTPTELESPQAPAQPDTPVDPGGPVDPARGDPLAGC